MRVAGVFFVVALWVVGCAEVRPPPPAPPRQARLELKLDRLDLGNGLRVVLVEDPRATDVSVTMRYAVGAADEQPDEAGVAHLVEHLMFDQVVGTQTVYAKLDAAATSHNAFTTHDATTYWARGAPEHLEELLAVDAVRLALRCTSITEEAFEREREVVRNELRQRASDTRLATTLAAAVYPDGHPYRRAVGGDDASVAALTRAQACAFADAHYAPGNAVLVVAGPLDVAQLTRALAKFVAAVPARPSAPRRALPAAANPTQLVEAPAGVVAEPTLVVAWPLPDEPGARTRATAVAGVIESALDNEIAGRVVALPIGGTRAPRLAFALVPGSHETLAELRAAVPRAIERVPALLGDLRHDAIQAFVFQTLQQSAIHDVFAGLESGVARDSRLADDVLAGRDPRVALADTMAALRALTSEAAIATARDVFAVARATEIVLAPAAEAPVGSPAASAPVAEAPAAPATLAGNRAEVRDLGLRRDPGDLAEAHRPLALAAARGAAPRVRALPNGMTVVLAPDTSVPVVDVRLVFDAGSASELPHARGSAVLAARGLHFDPSALEAAAQFVGAGGNLAVDTELEHTTFSVRGLDMYLDLLLSGLSHLVRDGRYDRDAVAIAAALRHAETKRTSRAAADAALDQAWRSALYGVDHPYAVARSPSRTLDLGDAILFRRTHFTPRHATLVISGHFDAALADRWIDFLFADWAGTAADSAPLPPPPVATSAPAAIAIDRPGAALVGVLAAFPATAGTRAQQLVVAEMLAELAGDVRAELGSSYELDAALAEQRLASRYVLAGAVDAARARDALALLADKLAQVARDPAARARSFLVARARVAARLAATESTAAGLADTIEAELDLAHAPGADRAEAARVAALIVDEMGPALGELALSQAVVAMAGPHAEVAAAFAALGRTPDAIAPPPPPPVDAAAGARVARTYDEYLSRRLAFVAAPAYAVGNVAFSTLRPGPAHELVTGSQRVDGPEGVVELGTWFGSVRGAVELAAAHVSGTREERTLTGNIPHPLAATSVFAAAVVGAEWRRLWGDVAVGGRFTEVTSPDSSQTATGATALGLAVDLGVDVVSFGAHHVAALLRCDVEVGGATSFATLGIGAAYRY